MSEQKRKLFDEKGRLTKEAIKYAENINIKDYLENAGFSLKKDSSKYYSMVDHDSFKINNQTNEWYWNSRGRGGNSINLLMEEELFDMSFRQAVIELNKEGKEMIQSEYGVRKNKEKEPYEFPSNEMVKNTDKAKDYLIKERKINSDLVEDLISKGMIRQDERNNVVYPWATNGQIVGHNKEGTYKPKEKQRFKQISSNGQQEFGFSFKTGKGKPKNFFYFESEVDAMSYVSLHGLQPDSKYMSMRGVNNEALVYKSWEENFKTYGDMPNIVYCVDNDEAGQNFIKKRLENNFIRNDTNEEIDVYIHSPNKQDGVKDWNDILKQREGKKLEEYERTYPQHMNDYRKMELQIKQKDSKGLEL